MGKKNIFLFIMILLFGTTVYADTVWRTGKYDNNAEIERKLSIPNASRLRVTVKGQTEQGYDFFYIYDNNGNLLRKLSGSINQTFIVDGASITAKLTSDYSVTYPGVTVRIRKVNAPPPDTQKPIITLLGDTTVTLTQGDVYSDPGAVAYDNVDGNITANIEVNSTVDTSTAGTYTVTYSVSDAAGNAADEAVRTVVVQEAPDTQKPIITLLGDTTVTLTQGDVYSDPGAVAFDNVDGNITANIEVNSTVDTSSPGTYTVTYSVSDAAGNAADEVVRTVMVQEDSVPDKVFAFYADEHNDFNDTTTGEGTGGRVLQIDIENMRLANSIDAPGIHVHHADNAFNSKIYGVPKGSNFVNVIELQRDTNDSISMQITKQITLTHKPRSADAYNKKYNVVLMAATNRPMGSFINTETDEVVGTIGEETDCTLTDGTRLLSHSDANTPEGALKYQCMVVDHGGDQVSGHPYWLTEDIAAIVDRSNRQISVYRINQVGTQLRATLMNRVATRTSVHQIVPRDRNHLPADQQADFYAVEEGKHADPDDFSGGIAHALIHLKLTTGGLRLVRRMDLQRPEVLPKEKAERILNACISIYRGTFTEALTGPSQTREDRYNELFRQEGITRNPDQDPYNDFPVDCFYPGIPGGHNADFAPNNKHLYINMAGGALSVVDVNRWKIANNIDIGIRTAPGHTCFSEKNNVAITSNHGFSSIFGGEAMTRSIRYINSERPIGYYWIKIPFAREHITDTAISHSCYVDKSGDNYYNFYVDGGTFYKIDMSRVFNNPRNGSSDLVTDSLYTGGIPIQGSYINMKNIKKGN